MPSAEVDTDNILMGNIKMVPGLRELSVLRGDSLNEAVLSTNIAQH